MNNWSAEAWSHVVDSAAGRQSCVCGSHCARLIRVNLWPTPARPMGRISIYLSADSGQPARSSGTDNDQRPACVSRMRGEKRLAARVLIPDYRLTVPCSGIGLGIQPVRVSVGSFPLHSLQIGLSSSPRCAQRSPSVMRSGAENPAPPTAGLPPWLPRDRLPVAFRGYSNSCCHGLGLASARSH